MADLPARNTRQIRLALKALELLPFPWRFSHASLDARQDFLRRLERSSIPFAGDLLLLLKVVAGLGYGNDSAGPRRGRLRDALRDLQRTGRGRTDDRGAR